MTAQELDTMVQAMRTRYNAVEGRTDVTDHIHYLIQGLHAIERHDLASKLWDLYCEIENIETEEIINIGTISEK